MKHNHNHLLPNRRAHEGRNGLLSAIQISSRSLVLILITSFCSCKKFVEIPPSTSQITNQTIFSSDASATSAVLGIYINIINPFGSYYVSTPLNGQITIFTGLSADELYPTDPSSTDFEVYQNALNGQSETLQLWNSFYPTIYQCNAIIAGLNGSSAISSATKKQLLGECKLMRALNYFNFVNLYGPVPLVLTTDYKANAALPRSSTADVYNQIIADLTDAQNLLSTGYVTSGKARPNKYAATALLAKVYLYQQQWAKAEAAATDVIANGGYSINANLNGVFLANSTEAIWQLQPAFPGAETPEASSFVPSYPGSAPTYGLSTYLMNSFEIGDQRKVNWIDSANVSGTNYYYPYKYKLLQDNNATPLEYYMLFRLGEQYLIRAEARAQQGNLPGGLTDLNVIRKRAGLANSAAGSQTLLLQAIMHERQVELFCELGNRWYDLKRTGTVNTVMPPICTAKGGNWSPNWQLYPVPTNELQSDPFLKQNPGY